MLRNEARATTLVAEADRIEDAQLHGETSASVSEMRLFDIVDQHSGSDQMGDTAAVITVGASGNNLGIITAANGMASKLFGYSKWQMERRNVSMLMPQPFAAAHDSFLKRYVATGTGR